MQLEELISFINNTEFLNQIDSSKIPNINLYMDQVLSFMNENLEHYKRNSNDKILTKSMINNYVKNDIIPKPEKKKYYPQHIIALIYMFYLKQILSLDDVQTVIRQYTDKHFNNNNNDLYKAFLESEQKEEENLEKELEVLANNLYKDYSSVNFDDDEIIFLFIMLLSSRANTYKVIIEKLIDSLPENKKHDKKQV